MKSIFSRLCYGRGVLCGYMSKNKSVIAEN